MIRTPEFITFTGVDDWTDIDEMRRLSDRYPIEWGVLFSPSRQGKHPRYPGGDMLSRLLWSDLRMAAHLCGEHSRNIMEGRHIETPVDLGYFKRIQINHRAPVPHMVADFSRGWGPTCIVQSRGDRFPALRHSRIQYLHDQSGGRGVEPAAWPQRQEYHDLVGYAGGINPANVARVLDAINDDRPYWIDMESGVRTDDRFDLNLCRQVCEIVYGGGNV